jgi:hypothetical protein
MAAITVLPISVSVPVMKKRSGKIPGMQHLCVKEWDNAFRSEEVS